MREAYEEIGLDPNAVEIIGVTPGTPDRTMRFLSCGVVGYLGDLEKIDLEPNPDEVEHIFTVPIETLLSDKVFKQTHFRDDYKICIYLLGSENFNVIHIL